MQSSNQNPQIGLRHISNARIFFQKKYFKKNELSCSMQLVSFTLQELKQKKQKKVFRCSMQLA